MEFRLRVLSGLCMFQSDSQDRKEQNKGLQYSRCICYLSQNVAKAGNVFLLRPVICESSWYSLQPWTGQPNHRVSRVQCVCFSLLCPGSSRKWMGSVNIFWVFTSLHRKLIYPSDSGIQILVFRCLKFRKYSSEPNLLLWAYQIVAHKLNF